MKVKRKTRRSKPDPAILSDIVKRVVRAAKPEKIVLFGSAARGEMGPHSDIDVLVIKRGKFNYWRLLDTIREGLWEVDMPVDVVVAAPEDVERYRDSHCMVICPAMREGKAIYGAKAVSTGRSTQMPKSSAQQPGPRQVARPRSVA